MILVVVHDTTRYLLIATIGDPHHSRNVFTHYILEAMQLVIYKS